MGRKKFYKICFTFFLFFLITVFLVRVVILYGEVQKIEEKNVNEKAKIVLIKKSLAMQDDLLSKLGCNSLLLGKYKKKYNFTCDGSELFEGVMGLVNKFDLTVLNLQAKKIKLKNKRKIPSLEVTLTISYSNLINLLKAVSNSRNLIVPISFSLEGNNKKSDNQLRCLIIFVSSQKRFSKPNFRFDAKKFADQVGLLKQKNPFIKKRTEYFDNKENLLNANLKASFVGNISSETQVWRIYSTLDGSYYHENN